MGSGITIPGQVPNDGRIIGIPVRGLPTATLLQIQWNDTDKVFEFVAGGGGLSGDIAFMSKKQFDGDLLNANGTLAAAGTIASIVPANLKTFYYAGGSIANFSGNDNATSELQNNSVIKEKYLIGAGTTTTLKTAIGAFQLKGDSLDGDGALIYRVQYVAGTSTINAMMYGFITDTGVDPTA